MDSIKSIIKYGLSLVGLDKHLEYYTNRRIIIEHAKLKKTKDYSRTKLFCNYHSQVLFIHIPKAAGMSVVDTLYNNNYSNHASALDYLKEDETRFRQLFSFAIVRNPYARLYSAFMYLKSGGMSIIDKVWWDLYLSEYENFESFIVDGGLVKAVECHAQHFIAQYNFIFHRDEQLCKYIGYIENIKEIEDVLSEKLNREISLTKKNVVSREEKDMDTIYTREMYNVVNKIYKKDFELLGYEVK